MIPDPNPPHTWVSVRDHGSPAWPGQKRPPRGTFHPPYHNGGSLEAKRRGILRRGGQPGLWSRCLDNTPPGAGRLPRAPSPPPGGSEKGAKGDFLILRAIASVC